jgi:hypothetical protein
VRTNYLRVTVNLTVDQRIELLRLGGAKWARAQIDMHTRLPRAVHTRFIRPADLKTVQACVGMDEHVRAQFNELGASPWLRAILQNSIDERKANRARING